MSETFRIVLEKAPTHSNVKIQNEDVLGKSCPEESGVREAPFYFKRQKY